MIVTFILANLERLPVHAQLTVRYLVPVVPLGLYGVAVSKQFSALPERSGAGLSACSSLSLGLTVSVSSPHTPSSA
jgi:hypothetical protein